MLRVFEDNIWFPWLITAIIAITIFYVSSLSFGPSGLGSKLLPFLYHLIAFFFLGLFLAISITKGKSKTIIWLSILISILYAISDEVHQLFVPFRNFSVTDILTDSVGIMVATVIYILILTYRKN